MRLTDLTATEQLKQPALTSLVARLERDGLVSRRRDPRDGRAILISLTRVGREIVASRHADREAQLARLAEQLNDRERDVLAGCAPVLARLTQIAMVGDATGAGPAPGGGGRQ